LTEVRGIANLKDLVLMQGLVHGRRSVCSHPKARSELDDAGSGSQSEDYDLKGLESHEGDGKKKKDGSSKVTTSGGRDHKLPDRGDGDDIWDSMLVSAS
ncbi:hypothetical protein GW17_00050383, partial [Ensete ventricosum]